MSWNIILLVWNYQVETLQLAYLHIDSSLFKVRHILKNGAYLLLKYAKLGMKNVVLKNRQYFVMFDEFFNVVKMVSANMDLPLMLQKGLFIFFSSENWGGGGEERELKRAFATKSYPFIMLAIVII